jgi:parallel beta-helix repeat protein
MTKKSCSFTVMTTLALFAALPLLGTAPVQAQSQCQPTPVTACGQVLDAAGEYVLIADLDCTGTPGNYSGIAITGSDVVLHLGGHTLSSSDCDLAREISGIFVAGGITGVKIHGGVVVGFNDGVVLSSSISRVSGMTVKNSCVSGILVQGEKNRVETSVVTGSGQDGIALSPASDSVIRSNYCAGNRRAGVGLSDSAHDNTIADNVLNDNGGAGEGHGVAVFNGTNNVVRDNDASYNDIGIRISSAVNPTGDPQLGNKVVSNTVSGNTHTGIWIEAAGAPSIVRLNSVLGSGDADMLDDSAACDGNIWKKNVFVTDVVAGLSDGGPCTGCIK